MKLLLDTHIALDVLLKRMPWLPEAEALWEANDLGRFTACLTATTITDIFYIAEKRQGLVKANLSVDICLEAFEICDVTVSALRLARTYPGQDFEDNLQIACAVLYNLDGIVTRDQTGFNASPIPVFTPTAVLQTLIHN